MELYKKHRPKTLSEVVGQPEAVKVLGEMLRGRSVPHAILFAGSSGCGKTTLARILRMELGCKGMDFEEINCAAVDGAIETVRNIQQRMGGHPMGSPCRIWLLDEIQSLSRAGFAQQALLKMLEDTPEHVYFLLCTTDPDKVLATIRNRCTRIAVKPLQPKDMESLLRSVIGKEGTKVSDEVVDRIVEKAEGSPRAALVSLGSVIGLPDGERLEAVERSDARGQAIELARALMNPRFRWPDVAKLLKSLEGEEPESLRRMVLGYARSVLLGGGQSSVRAYNVIYGFEGNMFDSGAAGLARACWDVINGK